jgi:YD repeat-containing protein
VAIPLRPATAAVTVNGQTAERQGEYFRRELSVAGTAPSWLNIDLSVSGGGSITNRKAYVPPQAEGFGHDADGNLTTDGRWEYGWDAENRLVEVRSREQAYTNGIPRERVRFDYDAAGRVLERRQHVWSGGGWSTNRVTRYLYDGWQCIAEFDGTGTLARKLVWGLDISESRRGAGGLGGLLWMDSPTQGRHLYCYDGNGSVMGLIGTNKTVTARYEYGPFGRGNGVSPRHFTNGCDRPRGSHCGAGCREQLRTDGTGCEVIPAGGGERGGSEGPCGADTRQMSNVED